MSRVRSDGRGACQLARARDVLDRALGYTDVGTLDNVQRVRRVDLALERALDRAGGSVPKHGTRGGSSTPEGRDERNEQAATIAQAERDATELRRLCKLVATAADQIERIVVRQVEVIHPGRRPESLPGCKTCARTDENGRGGHFAEVWEKRPSAGLCYRCYEFRGRFGENPPIMWCHLLHTEGRDRADRWLKRDNPALWAKATETQPEPEPETAGGRTTCGHPVWTGTEEAPCALGPNHGGTCAAVAEVSVAPS